MLNQRFLQTRPVLSIIYFILEAVNLNGNKVS